MPTPAVAKQQEAEATERAAAGNEPALNAGALDVVDDSADAALPPNPSDPDRGSTQPKISGFDKKRSDIVARFRQDRSTAANDEVDRISDFARSGLPPEFAAPAPAEVDPVDVVDPIDTEPAPAPESATTPMVKLKINGVVKEVPLDEALGKAQIAYASENILEDVKALRKEFGDLVRGQNQPPRQGQPALHQGAADMTQPPAAPGPQPAGEDPDTTDAITKLVETLQFGDPAEARALLQNTIAAESTKVVTHLLANDRLRDEGARSQKVLTDFLEQNADIASDTRARAVVEQMIYEQQIADIRALGVDPNQIQTATGGPPTPAHIADAHRWYRANGFKVRSPREMLETAVSDFKAWKGVSEPAADPAKVAPRVDISIDRSTRRQAVPQQPSRTAVPRQQEQPAPVARDRSQIVADMATKRGLPRGKIVA